MPRINVNGVAGKLITLDLPEHQEATSLCIKELIEANAGIRFEQQRLLVGEVELKDSAAVTSEAVTLVRCEPDAAPEGTLEAELAGRGYVQIRRIDAGCFGSSAVLLRRPQGGRAVANIVDLSKVSNANSEHDEIFRLSRAWCQVRHPFILPMYEQMQVGATLCTVAEHHASGSLASALRAQESVGQRFAEEHICRWLAQVTLALQHLHAVGLLHRDLRLESCLLSETGDVKLSPGRIVLEPVDEHNLAQSRPYSWQTEMRHSGVILVQLCALNSKELLELGMYEGKLLYEIEGPDTYSNDLKCLLKQLLSPKEGCCPSAVEILNMPCMNLALLPMHAEDGLESAFKLEEPLQAGDYAKHDNVEFWSVSHKEWLAARVKAVDAYNRVKVDLKPNTWLSMEVQATRIRRRRAAEHNCESLPSGIMENMSGFEGQPAPAESMETPPEDEVTIYPVDKMRLVHKRKDRQWQCLSKKETADTPGHLQTSRDSRPLSSRRSKQAARPASSPALPNGDDSCCGRRVKKECREGRNLSNRSGNVPFFNASASSKMSKQRCRSVSRGTPAGDLKPDPPRVAAPKSPPMPTCASRSLPSSFDPSRLARSGLQQQLIGSKAPGPLPSLPKQQNSAEAIKFIRSINLSRPASM